MQTRYEEERGHMLIVPFAGVSKLNIYSSSSKNKYTVLFISSCIVGFSPVLLRSFCNFSLKVAEWLLNVI